MSEPTVMSELNDHPPSLNTLARRVLSTGLGALQNRGELLLVEWQQEKARLTELLFWAVGLMFLGIMALLLLTGTIIFLFSEDLRKYVAAGFTVLYLGGAIWGVIVVRSLIKREPFSETIEQVKKDSECLESFK
jgi:uncharacterized membrane protein YqjE